MSQSRHFIGKLCDCGNRNVITHSPTRIAMTKSYDPKDDFVPLESVLEDDMETAKLNSSAKYSESCCLHGAPCSSVKSGNRTRLSSRQSRNSSDSENQNLGYPPTSSSKKMKKKRSKHSTSKDAAYEKVQIDAKSGPKVVGHMKKTRWPLSDVTRDMNYSTGSFSPRKSINNINHDKSDDDTFYDFLSDNYRDKNDSDGQSLGRRKDKKQRRPYTEKYPKLESVLEDTGYIELKVSTSTEEESQPRSKTPKSARRKNKKTRRNSANPWSNLPYADLGYLEDKRGGESSESCSDVRTAAKSEAITEQEFISQASDLELICRYYIGHKTLEEAEGKNYFFADSCYFYHRLPDFNGDYGNLPKCVRLFVLYITPSKQFKHYAIIKRGENYYVECDKIRRFSSLNDLVRFYALNKCFVGIDGEKQRFPDALNYASVMSSPSMQPFAEQEPQQQVGFESDASNFPPEMSPPSVFACFNDFPPSYPYTGPSMNPSTSTKITFSPPCYFAESSGFAPNNFGEQYNFNPYNYQQPPPSYPTKIDSFYFMDFMGAEQPQQYYPVRFDSDALNYASVMSSPSMQPFVEQQPQQPYYPVRFDSDALNYLPAMSPPPIYPCFNGFPTSHAYSGPTMNPPTSATEIPFAPGHFNEPPEFAPNNFAEQYNFNSCHYQQPPPTYPTEIDSFYFMDENSLTSSSNTTFPTQLNDSSLRFSAASSNFGVAENSKEKIKRIQMEIEDAKKVLELYTELEKIKLETVKQLEKFEVVDQICRKKESLIASNSSDLKNRVFQAMNLNNGGRSTYFEKNSLNQSGKTRDDKIGSKVSYKKRYRSFLNQIDIFDRGVEFLGPISDEDSDEEFSTYRNATIKNKKPSSK